METCRIKGREPALHNSNGEAQAHWHSGGGGWENPLPVYVLALST
jgi:hypothetical protein